MQDFDSRTSKNEKYLKRNIVFAYLMKQKRYIAYVIILLAIMLFLIYYYNFNVTLVFFGIIVATILIAFEGEIRKRL